MRQPHALAAIENFAVDPQRACTHVYGMFVPVVLLLVVVAYRVVLGMVGSADHQWLHNFSPLAAVALCGAVYLPRRYAFVLPLGILFASDLILNLVHYQRPFLALEIVPRYVALALIIAMGLGLRRWRRPVGLPSLLAASFAGSVAFYLISNTGSWIGEPAYAKTVNGWLQALTVGLPGYPPTWWFYRHTMVSDLLFTLIFAGCVALAQRGAAVSPAYDHQEAPL